MPSPRLLLILTSLLTLLIAGPASARPDHDDRGQGKQGRHGKRGHQHPRGDVKLQLLGINDFHGNLEPPTGSGGLIAEKPDLPPVAAGGAAFLASHIRKLQAGKRNSMVVSAGDLIGASPLLSGLFHDEPTIEAMNQIGLDLSSVGNHEFDEGATELARMQRGGCHPTDGCDGSQPFTGADFRFLSANVVDKRTGKPFFAPYAIRKFQGIRVGFIGMTLEGTPQIVSPAGITNLEFRDEADTANRYARELRRRYGVEAIVVLLHEGGLPTPPAGIDACNVAGPIVDIVNRTSQDVDAFVTGHTHQAYRCNWDGRPVTSASSFGRLVTNIELTLSRRTRDVVRSKTTADNVIVDRTSVQPDAGILSLIARFSEIAKPIAGTIVGQISQNITTTKDDSGENAAGNLIADAQLADTDDPARGAAVAALMNPGGVRADFTVAQSSAGEAPGQVTYSEAFTVQPFNNSVVTQTFTGAELLEVLKDQWCGIGQANATVLLPSAGFDYTYDQSVATDIQGDDCAGAPNPVTGLTIGGVAVSPTAEYRITTNNFLADGGDGFASLTVGRDRTTLADFDIDSLVRYLAPTKPPGARIGPPALDRIDVVP
jgi:5'-nucleotidase